jgi:hypothetical protein
MIQFIRQTKCHIGEFVADFGRSKAKRHQLLTKNGKPYSKTADKRKQSYINSCMYLNIICL